MWDMKDRPDRQSHRLKNFDYTEPRSYFVTLCQDERKPIFGDVDGDRTILSPLGIIIERELLLVERRRAPWVFVGEYIVMPNHVHVVFSNRRGSVEIHRRGEVDRRKTHVFLQVKLRFAEPRPRIHAGRRFIRRRGRRERRPYS